MLFGAVFAKKSCVVASESFVCVENGSSWTLDLTNAGFAHDECREVCFFMPSQRRAWRLASEATGGAREGRRRGEPTTRGAPTD